MGDPLAGLTGEDRRRALEALLRDPEARAALAQEDPSRLFALLAVAPLPEATLEQVSREVARGIRRTGREAGAPMRARRWLAWGGMAAALALAGLLGLELRRTPEIPAPGAGPTADSRGAAPALPVTLEEQPAPREGLQLTLAGDRPSRVFDLAVGDVQVVMIFDEGLEL